MGPVVGQLVAPSELTGLSIPKGAVAIWGETWEGEPVIRALRPGFEVLLRGEFGRRFDLSGPTASICQECGDVLVSETPGKHIITLQTHYAAHGVPVGLLP